MQIRSLNQVTQTQFSGTRDLVAFLKPPAEKDDFLSVLMAQRTAKNSKPSAAKVLIDYLSGDKK